MNYGIGSRCRRPISSTLAQRCPDGLTRPHTHVPCARARAQPHEHGARLFARLTNGTLRGCCAAPRYTYSWRRFISSIRFRISIGTVIHRVAVGSSCVPTMRTHGSSPLQVRCGRGCHDRAQRTASGTRLAPPAPETSWETQLMRHRTHRICRDQGADLHVLTRADRWRCNGASGRHVGCRLATRLPTGTAVPALLLFSSCQSPTVRYRPDVVTGVIQYRASRRSRTVPSLRLACA